MDFLLHVKLEFYQGAKISEYDESTVSFPPDGSTVRKILRNLQKMKNEQITLIAFLGIDRMS
jgi:hypothetical protein